MNLLALAVLSLVSPGFLWCCEQIALTMDFLDRAGQPIMFYQFRQYRANDPRLVKFIQEGHSPIGSMGPGPTGHFPQGKLSPDDQGELFVSLSIKNGKLFFDYGTTVKWLAIGKDDALKLAAAIIEQANKL